MAPFLRASLQGNVRLGMYLSSKMSPVDHVDIPTTFPSQWTRSCMAINRASGSINWVVEGALAMSMESDKLKDSLKPLNDLSGKLILGAISYGGKWGSLSNKVTNLNIFSSFLSVEDMKSMTEGKICVKKGDYLAWEDMEWTLHGEARLENVDIDEPCEGAPLADFFFTRFSGWVSCMHFCENLGSRTPSVTSNEDWTILQTFLREKIYGRGLNSVQIWLPISDEEAEGVWKD